MKEIFAIILITALSLSACTPQKPDTQTGSAPLQTDILVTTPTISGKPLNPLVMPSKTPQPSLTLTASPIPPTATPDVNIELVNFTTQDDIKLSGTLFGE